MNHKLLVLPKKINFFFCSAYSLIVFKKSKDPLHRWSSCLDLCMFGLIWFERNDSD